MLSNIERGQRKLKMNTHEWWETNVKRERKRERERQSESILTMLPSHLCLYECMVIDTRRGEERTSRRRKSNNSKSCFIPQQRSTVSLFNTQ